MDTGKAVKVLRERLGLSQAAFCEQLSISQSVLSRIESGEISIKDTMLIQIAQHFHAPELLIARFATCPVQRAARQMYPSLANTDQQLLVRQLHEDLSRVLASISECGETLPPETSPNYPLCLMQLHELATRAIHYLKSFRLLIYQG